MTMTEANQEELKKIIKDLIKNKDIFNEADSCIKGEKLYLILNPKAKRENINKNNRTKRQNVASSFSTFVEEKTKGAINKRTIQRSLRIGKCIKNVELRAEIKTIKKLYKRNELLKYISSFVQNKKQDKQNEEIEATTENLNNYLEKNKHLLASDKKGKSESKNKTISIDFEKCIIRENGKPHEFSKKELKELKTVIDDLIKTKTA